MKKILGLLLIVFVLLFLTGCEQTIQDIEYTISFETNCEQVLEDIKVKKGEKIPEPIELFKEGFTFDGWYHNDVEWNFIDNVVTEDMILVAMWEEIVVPSIVCTNDPNSLAIFVGENLQLSFQKNSMDYNQNLIYTVSDGNVLSINEFGVVTGLSEGIAQITATDKNDDSLNCVVEIIIRVNELNSIKITGETTIKVGDTVSYTAIFDPTYYKGEIVWSVSNDTFASIDPETGVLTALRENNVIYIFARSKEFPEIKGQKKITIKPKDEEPITGYPDLQGYTIKIAVPKNRLSDFDPFNNEYDAIDKEAKKQAFREAEALFNCTFEFVPYPDSAVFGSSRWDYIINQAQNNKGDFDFCIVPDSIIPKLVEGEAILSIEEFYVKHSNGLIDSTLVTSGSYQVNLYGVTGLYNGNYKDNISSIIGYNVGLLEQLQKVDPTLKDPAKIFNEGNWTHETFQNYIKQVQDAMSKAFGVEGTAGSEQQKYYAVSGWDAYWWTGLASNDGEPIGDVQTLRMNLNTPHKLEAANVVKYMYENSYADPYQNIDQNVTSWNEGLSLFNTGELWFIGDDSRWAKDLWGENTRYGYVPWPRANDVNFEDITVAMGGTMTCVMPVGRNYAWNGEECPPENIYRAFAEVLVRSKKTIDNELNNNYDSIIEKEALKYCHSEASQKAFIYMQNLINDGKVYFDPLVNAINRIEDLYLNKNAYIGAESLVTIKAAVNKYCVTKSVTTWDEAIATLQPVLTEQLRKAFC